MTRTLAEGRRAGLASVLGVATARVVHVALAAFGLSALLASSVIANRVLPACVRRALDRRLPAHRVLTSGGTLSRHVPGHAARLAAEGVRVDRRGVLVGRDDLWDARELYLAAT